MIQLLLHSFFSFSKKLWHNAFVFSPTIMPIMVTHLTPQLEPPNEITPRAFLVPNITSSLLSCGKRCRDVWVARKAMNLWKSFDQILINFQTNVRPNDHYPSSLGRHGSGHHPGWPSPFGKIFLTDGAATSSTSVSRQFLPDGSGRRTQLHARNF